MKVTIKYNGYGTLCVMSVEAVKVELFDDRLTVSSTSTGEYIEDEFNLFKGENVQDDIREIEHVWIDGSDDEPMSAAINKRIWDIGLMDTGRALNANIKAKDQKREKRGKREDD